MNSLLRVAGVAFVAHAYSNGAPSCVSPGEGPHRNAPSHGSAGHQLLISHEGRVSIKQGHDHFNGFLLMLPLETEVCELPSGIKSVTPGCDSHTAVTHSARVVGDVELRVGCRVGAACDGSATTFLLTTLEESWYNLSTRLPRTLAPCSGSANAKDSDPLEKQEAASLATLLLAGDKRLVRHPVPEATLQRQREFADSNLAHRVATALQGTGVLRRRPASLAAALVVGAEPNVRTEMADILVDPLLGVLSEWNAAGAQASKDLRLAATSAAEAMTGLLDVSGQTVTSQALEILCKSLRREGAPPAFVMWSLAGLTRVAARGAPFTAAVGDCPQLADTLVRLLHSSVIDCPRPSCHAPTYTSVASMDQEKWVAEALASAPQAPWMITWAALELVAVLSGAAVDEEGAWEAHRTAADVTVSRRALVQAGVIAPLCFLRFSPDALEGPPARQSLRALAGSCEAAKLDVDHYQSNLRLMQKPEKPSVVAGRSGEL